MREIRLSGSIGGAGKRTRSPSDVARPASIRTKQHPEAAADHRELDHRGEVERELLEPGDDTAAFFEPADASLDDIASPVGLFVEVWVAALERVPRIIAGGNYGRDSTSP
jgi:transcriptional regulator of nitric oxide reductase